MTTTTTPSLAANASGGFFSLVIYIIIYIYNKSVENRAKPTQTQGKPTHTHDNTAPVTIRVRCSRVWVRVEQNIPRGNPCHALVGAIVPSSPLLVIVIPVSLPLFRHCYLSWQWLGGWSGVPVVVLVVKKN